MPPVIVADSFWMRLRGLMFRDRAWLAGRGLLLPRTRSVHTFGMRFSLDLIWLDASGHVIRTERAVPPRRVRSCRGARAVVEIAS